MKNAALFKKELAFDQAQEARRHIKFTNEKP